MIVLICNNNNVRVSVMEEQVFDPGRTEQNVLRFCHEAFLTFRRLSSTVTRLSGKMNSHNIPAPHLSGCYRADVSSDFSVDFLVDYKVSNQIILKQTAFYT